ncbi:E3 ubiquitin-protein ligase RNF31-like isoform X1 [Xyrichtys novacula]|uniref:E3 ubiquitin-protein ligase RNF31-like isoform X1 n=1 Tax=Xyrichtys novacula TaxID=13765 RepID=A0AAV1GI10_XYRNO|nr:E3 ubiquitin-protein ligase RNF31-like isoform X1 [Xyrichtys novacula]
MSRVGSEAELRTLKECGYSFPAQTQSDLRTVRSLFSDLRLYVDFYCFPNKEKKRLLYLAGTLPVQYEGSEYNIPVCIWLHESHPASRPRCYVCPSVSMVINPTCPHVDASGNISLDALRSWTQGGSNLSLLVSEMRQAFQKTTPLYARHPGPAPPTAGAQTSPSAGRQTPSSSSSSSSFLVSGLTAGQSEQSRQVKVRRSYTEELLGIDFSAPPVSADAHFISPAHSSGLASVDPLRGMMGTLTLDSDRNRVSGTPGRMIQSETASHRTSAGLTDPVQGSEPKNFHPDQVQMASRLHGNQRALFLSLMTLKGRSFSPDDVLEAVQLNRDFPSALKFLTHCCPLCQDQVSFSKIVTMTHCSCFLCQACFKRFFSAAIKEKSVHQLVCPQCGRPEVKGQGGMEESMDYFNLLDTQIRHFLSPQIHELFQRKLRDRALQEMPNFCWCAHCSFGFLHEAQRLRMDCPSCKKSTCSQCRSPWSPQHQGRSCQQFRFLQLQNQQDQNLAPPSPGYNSIECPRCLSVFSLSRGGCLHFTCSQCLHQFCGGCSQTFSPGSVCSFSADCKTKGLHAHHPRDCLYHLRDWTVPRLHLLLQYYRVSPTWLEPANSGSPGGGRTGVCLVLEVRDDGSEGEEPCGRPAPPEFRGYCQSHYKERLVELINRCRGDPAVLFSVAEMKAELQRWLVEVPTRKPDEPELAYTQRLLLSVMMSSEKLTRERSWWSRRSGR